jgi:NADPH:quinone reductase-like Zn-dependent oxidoreductase
MTGKVKHTRGLELRTLISPDGALRLWLEDVPVPVPAADEVVVRVEAAPINPSDIMVLLGPPDLATLQGAGTADRPEVTATVPAARIDEVGAASIGRCRPATRARARSSPPGVTRKISSGGSWQRDRLGCMRNIASSSSPIVSPSPMDRRRRLERRPSSTR